MELRQKYLHGERIDSIYFGGGTPSLMTGAETTAILTKIHQLYKVSEDCEITLEANPDDLSLEKLKELKAAGINRLSIGVQSFHQKELEWMNRSHNATQSLKCIEDALASGFDNLSLDLIFGCPDSDEKSWQENLDIATSFDVPHLSCYGLTVEEKTALAHQVKTGQTKVASQESNAEQFEITMDYLASKGYEQYEISNYAKPGKHSRHNSNYWSKVNYLGLGPSAHSYDGNSREWNVANNQAYLNGLKARILPSTKEMLTEVDRYHEYLLTGLRIKTGISGSEINKEFPSFHPDFLLTASLLIDQKLLSTNGENIALTRKGKLLADQITSEFFIEQES